MEIPGLPSDMPENIKKQIQEIIEKIMKETGCSQDELMAQAFIIGDKTFPQGPNKSAPRDYFDEAKETGLEIPEGASERIMRIALLYCMGMCFNLNLSNIELKNVVKVHGVQMSVSGIEEAKNLKKIMKKAEEMFDSEPLGSECVKMASRWIMKKTKKESN